MFTLVGWIKHNLTRKLATFHNMAILVILCGSQNINKYKLKEIIGGRGSVGKKEVNRMKWYGGVEMTIIYYIRVLKLSKNINNLLKCESWEVFLNPWLRGAFLHQCNKPHSDELIRPGCNKTE